MSVEEERAVVRVRVTKCDGLLPVEFRSFAVDPQITSLEVLQHILIRAFDLNGRRNFGVSYLSRERSGAQLYMSLLSDWDLDAAFISAAKPYLQLKMEIKPSEDSPVMEEWDIISPKDVIGSEQLFADKTRSLASAALPFTQSLLSQVGRTLSRVQQAFSWSYGEELKPFKPPLSDAEFHNYLNGQGQLSRPEDLRLRIYHGGVEPSLRKVVWRYLLNVYPDGLSGQERMDYMKRKTREYDQLKREWTGRVSAEELEFIRGNVLKDVLRTDRAHPYYAGSEDSPHLSALTDLLTTFAITHPQISYCQGMSDIASPILAVMDNEAHAFICFCGIMKRLEGNFRPDGQLMSVKFQHLKLLLQYSDPEFYSYLVSRGADDLFFCYRWLLLELKREFVFDDALRMLEVTWSSLPPDPPETEVELLGPPLEAEDFNGKTEETTESRDKLYNGQEACKEQQRRRHMLRPTREPRARNASGESSGRGMGVALQGETPKPSFEKQPSFGEFSYYRAGGEDDFELEGGTAAIPSRQSTLDSEDDPGERAPLIDPAHRRSPPPFLSALPSWKSGPSVSASVSPSSWPDSLPQSPSSPSGDFRPVPAAQSPSSPRESSRTIPAVQSPSSPHSERSRTIPVIQSPSSPPSGGFRPIPSVQSPSSPVPSSAPQSRSLLSSPILSFGRSPNTTAAVSSSSSSSPSSAKPCSLPPPQEFGRGNPFMLFLCLSILLEHRDHIIRNSLDYNELAMHFDRLVRRHNLSRVLQRAKALFADYLQSELWDSEEGDEVSSDSPTAASAPPPPSAPPPSSPPPSSPPPSIPRQALYSPLALPQSQSSPNSTYNLANTIPSPVNTS